MKRIFFLLVVTAITLAATNVFAQATEPDPAPADPTPPLVHGPNFVDEDGDGYNDNAPDHDGDGIPNGVDPDYTAPGRQNGGRGFVDLNGDGINDNAGKGNRSAGKGRGGYGPKDGTGNQGVGPKDGTGYGAGDGTNTGTGTQKRKRNGQG